jgi:Kef-type K+ transport system membrane component KefB
MPAILTIGIIISAGFICGEIATKVKLPKVTGYIIAGVLLNPALFHLIPQDFTNHTDIVTNVALSFITFSVGGTLLYSHIKKLGKGILYITLFEAEFAFLAVVAGMLLITPFFITYPGAAWLTTFIPISLLIGCLASPTDPSATLAVAHEYKAKGKVTSTIMGVAALDDVTGIINYSIAIAFARGLVTHETLGVFFSILKPLIIIGGAVILGVVSGFIFNIVTSFIKKETEGVLIVFVFAMLSLCFGTAKVFGVDELLSTMIMGIYVTNFNPKRNLIFKILERYTEELIFVLFFTLSSMQLNFSVLFTYIILVVFFVIFRTIGKVLGTVTGAALAKSPVEVRKYTAGGLIPQGGIVVGLALLIKQNTAFGNISDIIISIIIGATVIHELIGPVLSEMAMKKAGEITVKPQ